VGILVPLLALAPVVYAQNIGGNYVNNEALSQAKNTSIGLVNQAPSELKSAYNQAKNTSLGLVNQAKNLFKNDTNSSKLLNLLEGDVGNLINEFSNLFSK
jgi:hypothetical protein